MENCDFMGIYVGIDASLCSSGIAIINGKDTLLKNIKTIPKGFENDLVRLKYIVDNICSLIPINVDMVCLEDVYVSPFAGSGLKLNGLAMLLRMKLYEMKVPFFVFSPSQSKKFILGVGKGDKNLILMACFRDYGIQCANDDQADALVGAKMAEAIHNYLNKTPLEFSKAKSETIRTIATERPCYNVDLEKYGVKRKNKDKDE